MRIMATELVEVAFDYQHAFHPFGYARNSTFNYNIWDTLNLYTYICTNNSRL